MISSTGPAGTGTIQLRAAESGELIAVMHGYNVGAYSQGAGLESWTGTTLEYGANAPTFALDRSLGRGIAAWSNGAGLSTYIRR